MILYHFSKGYYDILKPKYGRNRHSGEGKATNRKVIFLTTSDNMTMDNGNGENEYRYRYTVNINEDDKYLELEDDFNMLIESMCCEFNKINPFKWYFYTKELNYIKKDKWDSELEIYNLIKIVRKIIRVNIY